MIKFLRSLNPADYVTLLNAAFGLGAIYLVMEGSYDLAVILVLAALVFDWLDGKVARMTKKTSKLGHDLDSLADTISFGVAPAALLMALVDNQVAIVAAIAFALCGVLRLARFNVKPVKDGYEGIPIPLPSIVIALYYFAGLPLEYLPYLYFVLAGLMISSIKIKKIV